ncbi:MAG: decarboxylating 6-phosphogluconate dehydrogenase [Burkholderiaceae bacterium]|jgi:6-phosphogluconate dehydrogenase|nr:decarboxylating 6-phosphogluconate dehydrogenase [Burkholderiaceae bacterium]
MQLGMIGLGRMGVNLSRRLVRAGHNVTGFDPEPDARQALVKGGGQAVDSLQALVAALDKPRVVWTMVPAGAITERTVESLRGLLERGDTVIDGGNSFYKDSQRRARACAEHGIEYVDAGTSGGVWGLDEGYSLMVGGGDAVVERLRPIFEALAPAPDRGWGHVGPSGAGHFTKMVHNGIEYGLMQAYAEGFSVLSHKPDFELDLHQVAEIWRYGSVVRSWLLDLAARAFEENPTLDGIAPYVEDSGEGRWTVAEAIELNVPAPVITQSLIERLRSRDDDSFSDKLLAALRNQFGGHAMRKEE